MFIITTFTSLITLKNSKYLVFFIKDSLKIKSTVSLIFILCINTSCCFSQNRNENRRFLKWMTNDPVSFVRDFNKVQLLGTALTGVSVYSLTYMDQKNSTNFQRKFDSSTILNGVNAAGNIYYASAFAVSVFELLCLPIIPNIRMRLLRHFSRYCIIT